MTTHTLARSVLTALGLFFACASSGYARDVSFHGSLCNPAAAQANINIVNYSQFGVHNVSNFASALVNCGGANENFNVINAVTVFVYDRHSLADVTCTLVLVDLTGGTLFTDTQSSSGIDFLFQQLNFFPGIAAATISLQCSIPPLEVSPSGVSVSHVTTYGLTTP